MTTNEERREVASELRRTASHSLDGYSFQRSVEGTVFGTIGDRPWREIMTRLADLIEPEQRTHLGVEAAWDDFGENVFNDDALDDFGRFEKVYRICQEIAEPIEFHSETEPERTCRMNKKGPESVLSDWWECDECGCVVYPPCNEVIAKWALQYCPHCGAKVVDE